MRTLFNGLLICTLLLAGFGCSKDEPNSYGNERRPVDSLDPDNKGLQSKDVVTATDRMAMELLANSELRKANEKWTMVVMPVEDRTLDRDFTTNYDIFIERLRVKVAQQGHGSVAIVENKARLGNLQNKELDNAPAGRVQPDFALYGKVMDMPNRATNYYLVQFTITSLRDTPSARAGIQVWTGMYEVQVAR